MMKRFNYYICAAAAAAIMASCSGTPPFTGAWDAESPETIQTVSPAIPSLSTVNRFEFDGDGRDGGNVKFTGALSGSVVIALDSLTSDTRGFNATATVDGKWTYDVDDDDDLLLDFDTKSLTVKIDNTLALPEGTASRLEEAVRRAVLADLPRYSVIDDIEVSGDKRTMSFETRNPEATIVFRRAMP